MTLIDPASVPRPRVGSDPGARATAPVIRDPRPNAVAQFADSMRNISATFREMHKEKTALEDDAFLDNYSLEFAHRASDVQQEMLNSPAVGQEDFVDQLDQRMQGVQDEVFTTLADRGYQPSEQGRQRAISYAMANRVSTARTASVEAHNQRVMALYDDAQQTAQSIARDAGGTGDIQTAYQRIDGLYARMGKILAPDKARDFRNAARVTAVQSAIAGHIEREEFDAAQAIIDRETGFASDQASQSAQAIITAAKAGGVDPALALAIAHAESGFDPTAQNANSTAKGLFQITDATARALGLSPDAMLEEQANAGVTLTRTNIGSLKRALGTDPTPAEVYLAQVLGAGDAVKMLQADADTPVSQVLSEEVMRANPQFKDMTAASIVGWARRKMEVGLQAAGKALDGRDGVLAAGVPLSSIPSLGRSVADGKRSKSYEIQGAVADDIASIRATGQGVGIDPGQAQQFLTPAQYQRWREDREDAGTFWDTTHDMYTLTDTEISDRINALSPRPGESGYARKEQVQADVEKVAGMIRKSRADDPARSVAQVPAVADAVASFSQRSPSEGWQALIKARLDSQEQIGIPDYVRAPLTRDEASRLAAPITHASESEWHTRMEEMFADIEAIYGPYADEAATQVVGQYIKDREQAAYASSLIQQMLSDQQPVTPAQATIFDSIRETVAISGAAAAFSGTPEDARLISQAQQQFAERYGSGSSRFKGFGIFAGVPNVPPVEDVPTPDLQDVRDLMANPDKLLPQYIELFGVGQVPPELRDRIPVEMRALGKNGPS